MSKLILSNDTWLLTPSPTWTLIETLDFRDYSIGALSAGANTIGGKSWNWTTATGHSATNSSNGIRQLAAGSGNFSYLGRDLESLFTNTKNPIRVLMSAQNIDLVTTSSNVGIILTSAGAADNDRAPSIIIRLNGRSSGSDARAQAQRTGGTVGTNGGGFSNQDGSAFGSNPTSAVFEIYAWQSQAAVRIYTGTTSFPESQDPETVFSDSTNYFQCSMAGFGSSPGTAIDFFADVRIGMLAGGGGSQNADVDWLVYQVEEWA